MAWDPTFIASGMWSIPYFPENIIKKFSELREACAAKYQVITELFHRSIYQKDEDSIV